MAALHSTSASCCIPVRTDAAAGWIHCYGPTETTTFTATFRVPRDLETNLVKVPIGRPIDNTAVYLLDSHHRPVPVGVVGEIFIGGPGVAKGYRNDSELTSARFLPDPFSSTPEARMYRSGDLARYLPDGNLLFVGRTDDQGKIRGFRVEPGDIATQLLLHPDVAQAVVVSRRDGGVYRLCAYVVRSATRAIAPTELRAFLQRRLPAYMLPADIMIVSELPRTPAGKLDRRALPAPATAEERSPAAMPENSDEEKMLEIWRRILNREGLGVCDSFFQRGGHSLLGIRLLAQIERIWKRRLPVSALNEAPTIRELVKL